MPSSAPRADPAVAGHDLTAVQLLDHADVGAAAVLWSVTGVAASLDRHTGPVSIRAGVQWGGGGIVVGGTW